jgi:type III secretion protein C
MTLMATPAVLQAGPAPWPNAPFTYYADKKPLSSVLNDFALAYNLRLHMSHKLKDKVSGRFSMDNPTEFMNRLAGTFGFNWFTHSGVLYIGDNQDMVTQSIPTPAVRSGGNLRQLLSSLGVFDARFGWGEMPEMGIVMVSGPLAYVQLVERTLQSMPNAPGGQQIAVFRLKHASVEDRTIAYRDQSINVPGVTSILRNLVRGAYGGNVTVAGNQAAGRASGAAAFRGGDTSAPAPVGGESAVTANAASQGANTAPSATGAAANANSGNANASSSRPSIQSDQRINAVIVQDSPERMSLYKELIQQLDVPAPLVEIEALIIDVNINRLTELGLSWNAVMDKQRLALGFGDVSAAVDSKTLSVAASRAGGVTPGTLTAAGADYFVSRLRLLEQQGDASIQSRPSILTTENLGAVIDLSETFYIQTTSERSTLVTPVTAGITLRVTPRIVQEEPLYSIRLMVDIEDGQIQTQNTIGNIPTVVRGVVSTEASVGPNESLLLGGYNSVQSVKGQDKVPVLGDIPGIGALFRSTSDKLQRRERLFLIRSNVVGKMPAMALKGPVPVTVTPLGGELDNAAKIAQPQAELGGTPSPVVASIRAASLNASVNAQRAAAPGDARAADPVVQQVRDRQTQSILRDEIQRSKAQLQQVLLIPADSAKATDKRQAEVQRIEADVQALERELVRLEKR